MRSVKVLLLSLAMGIFLSACGLFQVVVAPPAPKEEPPKPPKKEEVVVEKEEKEEAKVVVVKVLNGQASYYADKFHGRSTASGEKYDKTKLTAAHRSLPFGTRVRVTNLRNGQQVIVRINDRGPFVDGRIVDLSRAAAEQIGMVRDGVVKVKVEVLKQ